MLFSQTSPSSGIPNSSGSGLFGSTNTGNSSQLFNFSLNANSQSNVSIPSNIGGASFQNSNLQTGVGNISNIFNSSLPNNSLSTNLSNSLSSSGSLFGASNLQIQPQIQNNSQAQYLPLNPTVGQLTNYIQSWKCEFDSIEAQLRENDRHVEYLTNNRLIEITRLCNTYKKGVERRSEEIENIKARQSRVQDSIEAIISEIAIVQQLSHDIIHVYDRIKDIDSSYSSRQMQPLRFPLPIFEFFCENMAKKCKYIEEIIGSLDKTVLLLREEMSNTTAEDALKYIAEIISNNYETFYELVTRCSQLHDKTESIINISKLHEVNRN